MVRIGWLAGLVRLLVRPGSRTREGGRHLGRAGGRVRCPRIETLEPRTLLSAMPRNGTPYIDLGPSDNVAWDQPRVAVELLTDAEGSGSVGPTLFNTFLLDTGANSIMAFATAVDNMDDPPYVYATEGRFREVGVAGEHFFDISAPYRFDFAGTSGVRNTLLDTRILSDPDNDISMFGPWGIVGMPAMVDRVTTLDFTVWTVVDDFDLYMRVDFAATVPADTGHRYSVKVDNRVSWDPDDQVVEGTHPPVWADIPFLTSIPVHNGVAAQGDFLFDTGAQMSVLSTRLATAIGLDSNGDGVLDDKDANFARYETVGGVGGKITAPVFLFDEVHVPTEQGVDLVWTDLQWLVLDIAGGLDGVFGSDLLTSGWIEAFAEDGKSGYLMEVHMDYRDMGTGGTGTIHFDLNPEVHQVIDPEGPGARVLESGWSTTVSEIGVDDTYQVALTQEPADEVTVTLTNKDGELVAVDASDPSHDYLVFTPSNWNVPQTVRVSAVDDTDVEGFHRSSIHHVSASNDPAYQAVGMPRVITNIIDNDTAGVMIIPSDGFTEVAEGGYSDTYQVVLTQKPTQDVTIHLENAQNQVKAVDAASAEGNPFLVFTSSNWDLPQTVLVTAVDDLYVERFHRGYVTHRISTGDSDYQQVFALQERVDIVDNDAWIRDNSQGPPGYTDGATWRSAHQGYLGDSRFHIPGTGSNIAAWSFSGMPAGYYEVLATWVAGSGRASNAPYTVYDGTASQGTLRLATQVNQKRNPNDEQADRYPWEFLGAVRVDTGTMTVQLSDDADGKVAADAVWARKLPDLPEGVMDNRYPDYAETGTGWQSSSWHLAGHPEPYQGNYRVHQPGSGSNTATWTFPGLAQGYYEVLTTWTAASGRASDAPYRVYDGTVSQSTLELAVHVNQKRMPNEVSGDGPGWKVLGSTHVASGTLTVQLRDNANGKVVADAVWIRRLPDLPPAVLDNRYPGYAETGEGWWTSDWQLAGRQAPYQENARLHQGGGDGSSSATWQWSGLPQGYYELFTTWTSASGRASHAPYEAYDGTNQGTLRLEVAVDQRVEARDVAFDNHGWNRLGTVMVTTGTLTVQLRDDADGKVVADAVWAKKLPDLPSGVMDNQYPGYEETGAGWWTSGWHLPGRQGPYQENYRLHKPGTGGAAAQWELGGLGSGTYEVYATWTSSSSRASDARYRIWDGTDITQIPELDVATNQRLEANDATYDNHGWELLGAAQVTTGTLTVVLSDQADGKVVADAVWVKKRSGGQAASTGASFTLDPATVTTDSGPSAAGPERTGRNEVEAAVFAAFQPNERLKGEKTVNYLAQSLAKSSRHLGRPRDSEERRRDMVFDDPALLASMLQDLD